MGNDSDSSRRSHQRSVPDEDGQTEVERPSKRYKHRHRHHHHRHRSKKDIEEPEEVEDKPADSVVYTPPLHLNAMGVDNSDRVMDDDVEEGEILDEDDGLSHEPSPSAAKSDNGPVNCPVDGVEPETKQNLPERCKVSPEEDAEDTDQIFRVVDKVEHNHTDGFDKHLTKKFRETYENRKEKSSSFERDRTYGEPSPSHDYHYETGERSRSVSNDHGRERSRSSSIANDFLSNGNRCEVIPKNDIDKEKSYCSGKLKDESKSLVTHVEREHSSSYTRYEMWNGSNRNWDSNAEDDMKQKKEREKTRDRDRTFKERDIRWHGDLEQTRLRDIERVETRETVPNKDWKRGEQEKSKDREVDEEKMEKEWDRYREKERLYKSRSETENCAEKVRNRHHERDRGRQREREDGRGRDRRDRDKGRERSKYGEREQEQDRGNEVDKDGQNEVRNRDRKTRRDLYKIGFVENATSCDRGKLTRAEDDKDEFEERIDFVLPEQDEDINRIKEENRKRRQQILEKYQNKERIMSHLEDSKKEEPTGDTINITVESSAGVASLDDKIEDSDILDTNSVFCVKKSPSNVVQPFFQTCSPVRLGEGTPKSEKSDETYCDDIFGETPAKASKMVKGDTLVQQSSGINDNWDDADGYYSYRFGEILDGRYEISAAHGKGVFSAVVRAKDLKAGACDLEDVAIKIIRNNDTMNKAGKNEVEILQKLAAADPENKRHCVRFLSSFKYRNHLCIVFESLHMNLREVLKKFGRNIGLRLTAVRAYAKQLFISLKHLKSCGVLHCDIKPDNMLVNEAKNVLKLCDFGNAMYSGKNDVTPYLVSRFYRAPEIILGLPYNHPMDMWSVGCCLYELYTGKVLFPGPSNNDMLRLHMELKGPFPKKMLKKGAFVDQHFDSDLSFNSLEEDPVTKKTLKKLLLNIKSKDIGSIISSYPGEDPKLLANFKDLLDKIFVLDPDRRITVSQALAHPFITGK